MEKYKLKAHLAAEMVALVVKNTLTKDKKDKPTHNMASKSQEDGP